LSVHWPIIRTCLIAPRGLAVVDDQREWRRIEILMGAFYLAREIEERCRTDTLGVILPTSGLFPIAALAGWILGKTVVPLNYLLKREELAYVVKDCGTDTIVTVGPMLDFMGARPDVPNLLHLEQLSFSGFPPIRWPMLNRDDDLAALLYTSGTSGKPKGVMLTHGNLAVNVKQCWRHVRFTSDDVIVGVLPQFHSFGLTVLTLLPMTLGCRVIYSARFVPHKIVDLIREHHATAFVGIPSMYAALARVKRAIPDDLASLRFVVSGGEPLPRSVCEAFRERFGIAICEGYGLTETAPVTNWRRPWEEKLGSVGAPLPGVRERIVDPENEEILGPGEKGEIRIAGPNVMAGYYHLPEMTARAFDQDGYFRTGDFGHFDDEGHLFITGRLKEMMIIGGENVFPREIEEVLEEHPAVRAAGVVGEPDDVRGEQPAAFVELEENASATESELREWCRERLAGYKVPRRVEILDELPRSPTGKVMRRELAQRLAKQHQQP